MDSLERQSFRNMVNWYSGELRYIHETGKRPGTLSGPTATKLVRKGALSHEKGGQRFYVLTEKAIRVLKELKEIGDE